MASLATVKHRVYSAITDTKELISEYQAELKTVETESVKGDYIFTIAEKQAELIKLEAAYKILNEGDS